MMVKALRMSFISTHVSKVSILVTYKFELIAFFKEEIGSCGCRVYLSFDVS